MFKRKGTLAGTIAIDRMPNVKMYSVSLTFFQVASRESVAPYGGHPPPEAYKEQISIREIGSSCSMPLPFEVTRKEGFYYLDIGVIAYLEENNRMYAQVEHFFPLTEPVHIERKRKVAIQLSAEWPDIPIEELGAYGTIKPDGKGKLYDV